MTGFFEWFVRHYDQNKSIDSKRVETSFEKSSHVEAPFKKLSRIIAKSSR